MIAVTSSVVFTTMVTMLGVMFASRWFELGFLDISGSTWHTARGREDAAQIHRYLHPFLHEGTPSGPELAGILAGMPEMDGALPLQGLVLKGPGGEPGPAWFDEWFVRGGNAKVLVVEDPLADFYFSMDPVWLGLATWDTVLTVVTMACLAAYIFTTERALRAVLVEPLGSLFDALIHGSGLIRQQMAPPGAPSASASRTQSGETVAPGSSPGARSRGAGTSRVAPAGGEDPGDDARPNIGDAVSSILAVTRRALGHWYSDPNMSNGGGDYLDDADDAEDPDAEGGRSGRRGHLGGPGSGSRGSHGHWDSRRGSSLMQDFSIKGSVSEYRELSSHVRDDGGFADPSLEGWRGDAAKSDLGGSGPVPGQPAPERRASDLEQQRRDALRLIFPPRILNGLGSSAWASHRLLHSDLLAVVNLLYFKLSISQRLCRREALVGWAQSALERHPQLPYHSSRRAIGSLHAVYALSRSPTFRDLPRTHFLALTLSSLGAHLASTGLRDEELEEFEHPLSITYYSRTPQAQGGIAELMSLARAPGAQIFGGMTPAENSLVRDLAVLCVTATAPSELRGLTQELHVEKSTILGIEQDTSTLRRLSMGPNAPRPPAVRKGPGPGIGLAAANPRLAMRVLAAASQMYHGWGSEDEFAEWEQAAVAQATLARAQAGRPLPAAEAEERQRREWTEERLPFLSALSGIANGDGSADLHSTVLANLEIFDAKRFADESDESRKAPAMPPGLNIAKVRISRSPAP